MSPEVSSNGRVTFRLRAPAAGQVVLQLEGAGSSPMARDRSGVWSVTTRPLEPDYNLIARGEAEPMLVVMPWGYGLPEILAGGFAGFGNDHAPRKIADALSRCHSLC